MAKVPLVVNIDRYVTPTPQISNSSFSGSQQLSESGGAKMAAANDDDSEVTCTDKGKENCQDVGQGQNRNEGEGARSNYTIDSNIMREPGTKVTASMKGEMVGYTLIDPMDPEDAELEWGSTSTPIALTLSPDWDGIREALNKATTGVGFVEWDEGRYAGIDGLGLALKFKFKFQIGPVPVVVIVSVSVGISLELEFSIQFAADEDSAYPCLDNKDCVESNTTPKSFIEATKHCNIQGGRLIQMNTQPEANALTTQLATSGVSETWIGAQSAFRHYPVTCADSYSAGHCDNSSRTQFRWVSNGVSFGEVRGKGSTQINEEIFGVSGTLNTTYPNQSAIFYRDDGRLGVAGVNVVKPYMCFFEGADREKFLKMSIALNTGAAAGFGLVGCSPNDNPGLCLESSFNVVALSIGPVYEHTFHWLVKQGESDSFGRRGTSSISVPWALKLFEGNVGASLNLWWFSIKWNIIGFDGFTVGEGKLYEYVIPFMENWNE